MRKCIRKYRFTLLPRLESDQLSQRPGTLAELDPDLTVFMRIAHHRAHLARCNSSVARGPTPLAPHGMAHCGTRLSHLQLFCFTLRLCLGFFSLRFLICFLLCFFIGFSFCLRLCFFSLRFLFYFLFSFFIGFSLRLRLFFSLRFLVFFLLRLYTQTQKSKRSKRSTKSPVDMHVSAPRASVALQPQPPMLLPLPQLLLLVPQPLVLMPQPLVLVPQPQASTFYRLQLYHHLRFLLALQ